MGIATTGVAACCVAVNHFWSFVIFYGLLPGMGCGVCHAASLAPALRWNWRHKGKVSGIIFLGRGLAPAFFIPLQKYFVNPNGAELVTEIESGEGYFHDPRLLRRVPHLFIAMAVVLAMMQLTGVSFLSNPTSGRDLEEANSQIDDWEEDVRPRIKDCCPVDGSPRPRQYRSAASGRAVVLPRQDVGTLTAAQVVGNRNFWQLWSFAFLHHSALAFLQAFWKAMAAHASPGVAMDDNALSTLGVAAAVAATVCRPLGGAAADSFGFRTTMLVATLVSATSALMLCSPLANVPYVTPAGCCSGS
eukprot:GHVT01102839.1.p1 GENE.GHVT01102839.1~~GHVT01102839.1.p1  ORF type:complete len:303 (+),score=59.31 GHVT01102839.1:1258-2166(+)